MDTEVTERKDDENSENNQSVDSKLKNLEEQFLPALDPALTPEPLHGVASASDGVAVAQSPDSSVAPTQVRRRGRGAARRTRNQAGQYEKKKETGAPSDHTGSSAPLTPISAALLGPLLRIPFSVLAARTGCVGVALAEDEYNLLIEALDGVIEAYEPRLTGRTASILVLSLALIGVAETKRQILLEFNEKIKENNTKNDISAQCDPGIRENR